MRLISGITGSGRVVPGRVLLEKGYEVHGILRRSSSFNTGRIEHLYFDGVGPRHEADPPGEPALGDMTDSSSLIRILTAGAAGRDIQSGSPEPCEGQL